ncbi:hypothetical protein KP509_15G065600 [Ceratopteris richardii]|uniref:Uncharacterized protein n=1 Tax=Ceratopteris richardii TaxID=49495 RepID=A0A8T2T5L2_CERRI|nr:hypothetical protein KP509_15G065600 [Ceratopteris richardii]
MNQTLLPMLLLPCFKIHIPLLGSSFKVCMPLKIKTIMDAYFPSNQCCCSPVSKSTYPSLKAPVLKYATPLKIKTIMDAYFPSNQCYCSPVSKSTYPCLKAPILNYACP